ncbi:MAG: glycoside hydrolase family 44 protein [Armatimonadota bacterium]
MSDNSFMDHRALTALALVAAGCRVAREPERDPDGAVPVRIDLGAKGRPIDPRIYGAAYAGAAGGAVRCPLNRFGGNNITRYNWRENADNKGADWFFESIGYPDPTPGGQAREFVAGSRKAGSAPMITVPMIGWTARLGPKRSRTWSYSVRKYGKQEKVDPEGWSDCGNGKRPDGKDIAGNDPNDANRAVDETFYRPWVEALTREFGSIEYWLLDNEPGLWHSTHRDVLPEGVRAGDLLNRMLRTARMIKSVDPKAKVCGFEEWGWTGYRYSGHDARIGARDGWGNFLSPLPDRKLMGGEDITPWLLRRMHEEGRKEGRRLLDVFTLHYYPQGGEFGGGTDTATCLRRNRSTRSLWDPDYRDETWINDRVRLIPRMREWVQRNHPGIPMGITEYNWGAETHINGATAQADVLGIFGREGLDLAARWAHPDAKTPTHKVFELFRSVDDGKRGFGDRSIPCVVPDCDDVSAFAAIDSQDGALTVVVVAKALEGSRTVRLDIPGFRSAGTAAAWQVNSENRIVRLPAGKDPLRITVPAPSITLLRLPSTV